MRYFYGALDEKYVKMSEIKVKANPLISHKFRSSQITKGKTSSKEFDKNDVQIVLKCTPDTLLNLCVKVVDAMPLPKVFKWTVEDVCKWLRERGYQQYQNTFRINFISGRKLLLIDASALPAMNIKDFDHIKDITRGIRSLFYFEMTKFARSLTLYPEFHNEVYKLLRVNTGTKYDEVRRSDLWHKMQLIRQKEPNYSHWEILEKWLGFDERPKQREYFGGIHRSNLYGCKPKPPEAPKASRHFPRCECIPPCKYLLRNSLTPWRFKCLSHLPAVEEFVENCPKCVSPCTCRWSSKKYMTHAVLDCIKKEHPKRYRGDQKHEGVVSHHSLHSSSFRFLS